MGPQPNGTHNPPRPKAGKQMVQPWSSSSPPRALWPLGRPDGRRTPTAQHHSTTTPRPVPPPGEGDEASEASMNPDAPIRSLRSLCTATGKRLRGNPPIRACTAGGPCRADPRRRCGCVLTAKLLPTDRPCMPLCQWLASCLGTASGGHAAPCPRCAKSRLFWTPSPNGQGDRSNYCVPRHGTARVLSNNELRGSISTPGARWASFFDQSTPVLVFSPPHLPIWSAFLQCLRI